jgi:hypothetical protein
VRDLKLVYDLQLDREISARREYELTVESQLRRELASELRAQATDEVAALRAELAALRNSLEILFGTDLDHLRALEKPQTLETDAAPARAYSDWARNGESAPVDWVSSDRVTAVPDDNALERTDEQSIIDVPEVGVSPAGGEPPLPPRQSAPGERVRLPYDAPPPAPEPRFEPRQPPPPPPPPQSEPQLQPAMQPESQEWQPAAAGGQWLPPGTPGSNWSGIDAASTPADAPPTGRRARHSSLDEPGGGPSGEAEPPPPRLAPAPPPEPAPRHRRADSLAGEPGESEGRRSQSGGESVADLLARLQVEPTGGGRRRRRDG